MPKRPTRLERRQAALQRAGGKIEYPVPYVGADPTASTARPMPYIRPLPDENGKHLPVKPAMPVCNTKALFRDK